MPAARRVGFNQPVDAGLVIAIVLVLSAYPTVEEG